MLNLAVLFVPVARRSPLLHYLGIGWEAAVRFHIFVARTLVLGVLVHGITYLVALTQGTMGPNFFYQFLAPIVCGICGAALIGVVAGFSWFRVVRHAHFELFYAVHHLFVATLPLVAVHTLWMQNRSPPPQSSFEWSQDLVLYYLVLPILVYGADRVARVVVSRAPTQLASIAATDAQSVKLALRVNHTFHPGQFAFLNCPSLSVLEWHPFSYVSNASDEVDDDLKLSQSNVQSQAKLGDLGKRVEFHILRTGDLQQSWSSQLHRVAVQSADVISSSVSAELMFEQNVQFRVDGPYGRYLTREQYDQFDRVLLVGGGIGLGPLIAVFESGDVPADRLKLVWIFKTPSHVRWYSRFFRDIRDPDQRDRIRLYATRQRVEDERLPLVMEENDMHGENMNAWPYNGIISNGRPPLQDVVNFGVANEPRGKCLCIMCGPESLSEDMCRAIVDDKHNWYFWNLSFRL